LDLSAAGSAVRGRCGGGRAGRGCDLIGTCRDQCWLITVVSARPGEVILHLW